MLLSVALLGALGFGWYQTRQKNQLAQFAENRYMAAFHNLKWTSENIEERMSRLLATNDVHQQENLLADLRVFSTQAVTSMSVLPFSTMNTPRVASYLNSLRDRSDELHYKVSSGSPITQQDWAQLSELNKQTRVFEGELSRMLGLVANNMVRWRDTAAVTGPARKTNGETPITRSYTAVDKALPAPPGEEHALQPGKSKLAKPRVDPGPRVDANVASEAVKRFVDLPLTGEPKLTGQSDPADKLGQLSLYFFDAQKTNGTPLSFGVSIHGGHVIYMMDGRLIQEKRFTKAQLVDRARQMLRRWGYGTVEYVSAIDNDGTMVMDFAPLENGISMRTDVIKVSLAMDNAELVAFDARSYWINRHPRQFPPPKVSAADARVRLAPRLTVQAEPTLAVVADRRDQERLTWAFIGKIDNQSFEIFVDTQSGQEVNLLRLAGDPNPMQ